MSLGVQRADRVKENPRGAYMSESTASAMQTQHPPIPHPPPKAPELQAGEQYHVEPVNF